MCTGGREGVRYVITKFSRMDSLTNFVTYGAPMRALRVRESSAINSSVLSLYGHRERQIRQQTVNSWASH